MEKIYLYLVCSTLCYCLSDCAQPHFPSQIVFSPDSGVTTYAIDEKNQRAYVTYPFTPSLTTTAYVMQHFPYAMPDSPQSMYYVQLSTLSPSNSCMYGTYWEYGGNTLNFFPSHWLQGNSFKIKNYLQFDYQMIHSNDSSEDYWYSNETCSIDSGDQYPCQEIYFKKNTDIPNRFIQVRRAQWKVIRETIYFTILSVGKPDDKYFNSMPRDWFTRCRDDDLEVFYSPQAVTVYLQDNVDVQVWLRSPPHRIKGNDSVSIQWKSVHCADCFTLSPTQMVFNARNFHDKQTLRITRLKNTEQTMLVPSFIGGGFDLVPPDDYPLDIL